MTSTGYSVCGILQLCFHPTCCVGYDCVLGKPVGLQDVCCLQIHTKLGFTSKCKSISKSCKKRSMISYTFFNTFLPFHQKTLLNKNQELWGIFAILLRCLWKFSRWIMWFQSAILYSKAEDRGVQPHQIFFMFKQNRNCYWHFAMIFVMNLYKVKQTQYKVIWNFDSSEMWLWLCQINMKTKR